MPLKWRVWLVRKLAGKHAFIINTNLRGSGLLYYPKNDDATLSFINNHIDYISENSPNPVPPAYQSFGSPYGTRAYGNTVQQPSSSAPLFSDETIRAYLLGSATESFPAKVWGEKRSPYPPVVQAIRESWAK